MLIFYCVCVMQVNIDDYTDDKNEEKNPYPVNDFPGAIQHSETKQKSKSYV